MSVIVSVEQIDQLKQQGVHRSHPAAFAGIESLVRRALNQRDRVRTILLNKAQLALDDYVERYGGGRSAYRQDANGQSTNEHSANGSSANEPIDGDDQLSCSDSIVSMLRELQQYLVTEWETEGRSASSDPSSMDQSNTRPSSLSLPALKSSEVSRRLQRQRRVDQFIDAALSAQPENPGPLNPETLAIRLLSQINDLSPEYIRHYVIYFDTLQWLASAKSS